MEGFLLFCENEKPGLHGNIHNHAKINNVCNNIQLIAYNVIIWCSSVGEELWFSTRRINFNIFFLWFITLHLRPIVAAMFIIQTTTRQLSISVLLIHTFLNIAFVSCLKLDSNQSTYVRSHILNDKREKWIIYKVRNIGNKLVCRFNLKIYLLRQSHWTSTKRGSEWPQKPKQFKVKRK